MSPNGPGTLMGSNGPGPRLKSAERPGPMGLDRPRLRLGPTSWDGHGGNSSLFLGGRLRSHRPYPIYGNKLAWKPLRLIASIHLIIIRICAHASSGYNKNSLSIMKQSLRYTKDRFCKTKTVLQTQQE